MHFHTFVLRILIPGLLDERKTGEGAHRGSHRCRLASCLENSQHFFFVRLGHGDG